MSRRTFLTARWQNLILANFAIPEELLRPLVPPGCELDRRDGACWGSLVGFQFLDTRVLGIGWPGFRNFPEWNLRFYVSHQGQRGVCFVREFVPQRTVATLARVLYNEPYRSARMSMAVTDSSDTLTAHYTVKWQGRVHSLCAVGAKPAVRPAPDSSEHWFKEHAWGFGTSRGGRLIRYEVNHPAWDVYPVREFTSDVDWAALYGPEWAPMNGAQPASVVLAAGSAVAVFPKG
ncbi:DUF2071 domain-containing protein [Gemmata sp. JC673]|uniref:DUF2071 domain-containing protein n=1 Tax=Gemmata algarum TaxID=2975278 RepID=A0ABU5EVL3_9BACT|nr:DUF2071 domain-containing protein [Gemmata algarum]MDY3558687.1 DUF2071 domain-containing protein [Gemmata algarum]